MLAIGLAIFSTVWALWLVFMIRYPARWNTHLNNLDNRLRGLGLVIPLWMKRAEQGLALKAIVAATTFLALCCLVIIIRHPNALDYLHHRSEP